MRDELMAAEAIDFHALTERFERVHSRRLALRQAALCDAWPLFEATRNPLFNKSLLWEQPDHETQVLDRMDAIVNAARSGKLAALSAVAKDTGQWASLYRFQPYLANPDYLEMGIWTSPNFWHGRFSLELVRTCIDAAFDMFDIPTLVGAASLENRSSCKLMELCGMAPTKLVYRRNEPGAEVQLQEFEISREDWAAGRKRALYEQVPIRGLAPEPVDPEPISIHPTIPAALQPRRWPSPAEVRPDRPPLGGPGARSTARRNAPPRAGGRAMASHLVGDASQSSIDLAEVNRGQTTEL